MKEVPEGSVPVGASCPTCKVADLVAPPDTDGSAWCPNEACPDFQFGFLRSLMLPIKRPKRDALNPPAPPAPSCLPVGGEVVGNLGQSGPAEVAAKDLRRLL